MTIHTVCILVSLLFCLPETYDNSGEGVRGTSKLRQEGVRRNGKFEEHCYTVVASHHRRLHGVCRVCICTP
jgi:hypothetical protein